MQACDAAAEHGQLAALQWLRAHGCPWDKEHCLMVASSDEWKPRETAEAPRWSDVIEWICAQPAEEVEGDAAHDTDEWVTGKNR
jgi:hypothetical protein